MNAAREVDVTFLMADLSGFTALTEVHGDFHAVSVTTRFSDIARAALAPAARLVERVGDQVLIVSPDATGALQTAVELVRVIADEPFFPRFRAGLHSGRAVERDGSYFGRTLNLTARVTAHARAGQILCTESVVTAAQQLQDVEIRPIGSVRFKNIADPVPVFDVLLREREGAMVAIDPVCRMQVRRDTAPAHVELDGRLYYFCSSGCAEAFAGRPEQYAKQ